MLSDPEQLGHADLSTTQIYAAAISGRRRATVMALEFGGSMDEAVAQVGASKART